MSKWQETEIGILPKDWKIASVIELQDEGILLVEDGNHGNNRPRSYEFEQEGISFIRAADIMDEEVVFPQASRINNTAYERIRKGKSKAGDILLTHKGTVGRVAYVPKTFQEKYVCSPQTTFYRSLDERKLNRRYLFFYLLSPLFQNQIGIFQGETDMAPYVSLTNQRSLIICLPPKRDQEEISKTLWSIHKKISLLRKQNQTLEKIAQTLFKHWFIDFEFPNKAGKPYRSSGGGMVASEMGQVPEGWEVSEIGKMLKTLGGGTPSTKEPDYWVDGDIQWYSPTDLTKNGDLFSLSSEKKITPTGLKKSSAKLFPPYSLMMTSRATVGEIANCNFTVTIQHHGN